MRDVVIVGAARTPIGSFLGALAASRRPSSAPSPSRRRSSAPASPAGDVSEVHHGLRAAGRRRPGAGAPGRARRRAARQAVAVHDRQQGLRLGPQGGRCSARRRSRPASATSSSPAAWSRCRTCPTCCRKAREGYRMGHAQVIDGMVHDGLWDPYNNYHMGDCAELCAKEKDITRAAQDEFAAESLPPRARAQKEGQLQGRDRRRSRSPQSKGAAQASSTTTRSPGAATSRSSPRCAPAFQKDGTVTAGNASSINDGAAALVLMSARGAPQRAAASRSRASSRPASHAQAPEWFTTAPAGAIEQRAQDARARRRTTSTSARSTRRSRSSRSRTTSCSASTRAGQRLRRRGRARPPDRRLGRAHPGHAAVTRWRRRGARARRARRCASAAARASRCSVGAQS